MTGVGAEDSATDMGVDKTTKTGDWEMDMEEEDLGSKVEGSSETVTNVESEKDGGYLAGKRNSLKSTTEGMAAEAVARVEHMKRSAAFRTHLA